MIEPARLRCRGNCCATYSYRRIEPARSVRSAAKLAVSATALRSSSSSVLGTICGCHRICNGLVVGRRAVSRCGRAADYVRWTVVVSGVFQVAAMCSRSAGRGNLLQRWLDRSLHPRRRHLGIPTLRCRQRSGSLPRQSRAPAYHRQRGGRSWGAGSPPAAWRLYSRRELDRAGIRCCQGLRDGIQQPEHWSGML